jgi:hypothetical protein
MKDETQNTNGFKLIVIASTALPLLLGGFLYILFRQRTLVMFDWFDLIGMTPAIDRLRAISLCFKSDIWPWVIYSLPDALWVFSFSSFVIHLWSEERAIALMLSVLVVFLSAALEIMQYFRMVPGSFDFLYLILILTFGAMPVFIFHFKQRSVPCSRTA